MVATLLYGTFGQPDPTPAQRAQSIADGIRCPSCKSQAVSSSDTPASKAVRELIKEQIAAGKSNEEIRDYVDSRYPDQNLLLDPSGSGFPILVWALPVIFVIVAVAGLLLAMTHRAVIEQAKGILMAVHRVDDVDAFELLRTESQHTNRTVRDVSATFVAHHTTR